ncbi:MAG: hypothetical protein ABL921_27255, partial [Pirellula sp.]
MNSIPRRRALQCLGGVALIPWMEASMHRSLANCSVANRSPAAPRIKIGQIGVGHGHANKISSYRASADYE